MGVNLLLTLMGDSFSVEKLALSLLRYNLYTSADFPHSGNKGVT